MEKKKMVIGCRIKTVFCILLVFCLAGCGSDSAKEVAVPAVPTVPAVSDTQAVVVAESTSETVENIELAEYESVLAQRISFSNESADKIGEYAAGIDVEYEYGSLYHLEEALQCYEGIGGYCEVSELKLIKNNKIEAEELFQVVLENNKDIPDKVIVMKDDIIKKTVDIVCDQINKKLAENNEIPLKRLEYTLANLKIFDFNNFGTAYVSYEEPMLCLNLISINSQQEIYPDKDIFDVTVRHEADHLLQVSYAKDGSYEANNGICYQFEELEIDSLFWKWLAEGSAEKMIVDINGDTYLYELEIRAIDSLTLATALEKSAEVRDIEELTVQHNIDRLYEKFYAKTTAEKEEILKMMFSYDLVCNNTEEFKALYEKEYGEAYKSSLEDEIQCSVACSAGQTLAKTFFTNLAKCVAANEVSVEEIFSFISLFERRLNSIIWFDNAVNREAKRRLFENYSVIQMQFFEEMSKYMEMDAEEVKALFCNYHLVSGSKNYYYSFLSKEKNDMFSEMRTDTIHMVTNSIISR